MKKLSLEDDHSKHTGGIEADDGVGVSIFKDLSVLPKPYLRLEKLHKDAITYIHIIHDAETKVQRIVTTSLDGFIKMLDARDGQIKKGFFVN